MSAAARHGRAGVPVVVGIVGLFAVCALALLSSPRHRAFYLGLATTAIPKPPAPALAVTRAPEPVGLRVPALAEDRRVRVAIADEVPRRLPADGPPTGWEVREFHGRADVELVRDAGRLAARLRTDASSFAIFRDLVLDLSHAPHLTWSWKVTRLPAPGDARDGNRNDQAVGVYVVFPRWPSPRTSSDVLGYVWDTRAPIGTRVVSRRADNVRFIVVESGSSRLDAWQQVTRNVAADYAALFGRPAPRVGRVAVMADSDDTGTTTDALVGDLTFSWTPPKSAENATIMLR